MSDAAESARAQLILADHASIDGSNKVNALGIGFQYAGLTQNAMTSPQSIVALIEFPYQHVGQEVAVEVALYGDGQLFNTPGPAGELTAIRFGQALIIEGGVAQMPGLRIPAGKVWCRHQLLANFTAGIPLAADVAYEWRLSIDSLHRPDWAVGFYVPTPAPPVVMG